MKPEQAGAAQDAMDDNIDYRFDEFNQRMIMLEQSYKLHTQEILGIQTRIEQLNKRISQMQKQVVFCIEHLNNSGIHKQEEGVKYE